MEIRAQEWRDALFLRYGIDPPDPPSTCDGCGAGLSINHALDCNKGGLVPTCHSELCDSVVDPLGKYFTPSHVRNDLLIYPGCAAR